MAIYILFDSSGILSPEEASVQDTFSAKNDREAIRKTKALWGRHSWALYEGDYLIAWKVWKWKKGKQIYDYWDKFQDQIKKQIKKSSFQQIQGNAIYGGMSDIIG